MAAAPTGLSILAQIGRFGGHYWLGFFGRFSHHFVGLRNAHDFFDGCFPLRDPPPSRPAAKFPCLRKSDIACRNSSTFTSSERVMPPRASFACSVLEAR
jgi:hypothetical protein